MPAKSHEFGLSTYIKHWKTEMITFRRPWAEQEINLQGKFFFPIVHILLYDLFPESPSFCSQKLTGLTKYFASAPPWASLSHGLGEEALCLLTDWANYWKVYQEKSRAQAVGLEFLFPKSIFPP